MRLTEPRSGTWCLRDSWALRDAITLCTAEFLTPTGTDLQTYVRFSPHRRHEQVRRDIAPQQRS